MGVELWPRALDREDRDDAKLAHTRTEERSGENLAVSLANHPVGKFRMRLPHHADEGLVGSSVDPSAEATAAPKVR